MPRTATTDRDAGAGPLAMGHAGTGAGVVGSGNGNGKAANNVSQDATAMGARGGVAQWEGSDISPGLTETSFAAEAHHAQAAFVDDDELVMEMALAQSLAENAHLYPPIMTSSGTPGRRSPYRGGVLTLFTPSPLPPGRGPDARHLSLGHEGGAVFMAPVPPFPSSS